VTDVLLPAGVLAASLTMAYFLCLRPMRRGHCGLGRARSSVDAEADHALRQARADLDRIQTGLVDDVGMRSSSSES